MSNDKILKKAMNQFFDYFKYFPQYPPRLDFDRIEFAKVLNKCVDDGFDYTIEKYGTKPINWFCIPDVIVD